MSDSRIHGRFHLDKSLVDVVSLTLPECTSLTFLGLPYLVCFPPLIQLRNRKHHVVLKLGQSELYNCAVFKCQVKILFLLKFNL